MRIGSIGWCRWLLYLVIVSGISVAGPSRLWAHACHLLLPSSAGPGLRLAIAAGGKLVTQANLGSVYLYGSCGDKLCTAANTKSGVDLRVWSMRNGKRVASFRLPKFQVPAAMDGAERLARLSPRTVWFAGSRSFGSRSLRLVALDARSGALRDMVKLPAARSSLLYHLDVAPGGIVLWCRYNRVPSQIFVRLAPRKVFKVRGSPRGPGGIVYVRGYGLVSWSKDGQIRRLSLPGSRGSKSGRICRITGPIVAVRAVQSGRNPLLACLITAHEVDGQPYRVGGSAIVLYSLRARHAIWTKHLRFPVSHRTFAVSPDGRTLALVDYATRRLLIYDRARRISTWVGIPKRYVLGIWARILGVK